MLQLPVDHQRPAMQTFQGATEAFTLSKKLTSELNALCRREEVTLFMTLLAAFKTLLHRYTGQTDLLVGSPVGSRRCVETEGLIGFFVNTLVFRSDLSGDPSFQKFLAQIRRVATAAYAHQDLPIEKLVEMLQPERSLSHNPLFQVVFTLQNAPRTLLRLPEVTITPWPIENTTSSSI